MVGCSAEIDGGVFLVGLFYAVMSLAALAGGFMYPACLSDTCAQLSGVFGRSWFLWGALFYAISAVICLTNVQPKRHVVAFLAGGATLHTALIVYGYVVYGSICPVCWKFAVLGIMLPVIYLWMPYAGAIAQKIRVPARALPVVMTAILIVNPVAGMGENSVTRVTENYLRGDVKAFDQDREHIITVSTAEGQVIELDISQKPVLFFAVWCPHCDDALREIAALPRQERPDIVVTYLNSGDRARVPEKLAQNGLAGEKYFLSETPPAWLYMVPTKTRWDDETKTLQIIEGTVIDPTPKAGASGGRKDR